MALTKTLLELTQDILSDINGDAVNSISDTEESEQIARIIQRTYRNMMSNSVWPHTRRALQLVPYSDSTKPTHISLPNNVKQLISVSYDRASLANPTRTYSLLKYRDPEDFLHISNSRTSANANTISVIDNSGIELFIINNKLPEYYTSFDDVTIVFDSYDALVDTTIQADKIQALAYIIPEFELEDDAIPDLPVDALSALYEEALSTAQWRIKQFQDIKAEANSVKQQRWLSRKAWRVNADRKFPDYGRKRGRSRDATFRQGH